MIHFSKPYVVEVANKAILKCEVSIDNKKDTIWFSVDQKYGQYLCYERSDAFVIAVLNYAMRNNHDIMCDVPISEDLYYNIDKYLIDAIVRYNPSWYRPVIIADVDFEPLPCAGAVGTGISCGVDSLHALANQTALKFKRHNITHLTFNNVGSHGEGERAVNLYNARLERPREFAAEYGSEFVASNSNLQDVVEQSHFKTHTYSSLFAVYCLQKLYSVYYYASGGYKYDEFTLVDAPMSCSGTYEMLSLPFFSTKNMRIYSEGADMTRMEKLRRIVAYSPSYKYLNVCLHDGDNCNVCEKCVRTLLGIDALGALDKFKNVFDIDYYRKHKSWYLEEMLKRMFDGRHDYFEIYPYFKNEISIWMRIQVMPYWITNFVRRIVPINSKLYKVLRGIKDRKKVYTNKAEN